MPTRLITVNPDKPEPDAIQAAAEVIRAGGLVAFPTETVYGLGADALNPAAAARIFAAKGRPASDPLIVHISNIDQLARVARDVPPEVQSLSTQFWPGALTLVLPRQKVVAMSVSAGRDTAAIRMPNHAVARALIEASGTPIAAPSANLFARPSPTTAQHVLDDLDGRIDLVLDGGPTVIGVESTVLDLTQDPPRLLRPGGVAFEAIQAVLPNAILDQRFVSAGESDEGMASPGMLDKHYSPRAKVLLFSGPLETTLAKMRRTAERVQADDETVGLLLRDEEVAAFNGLDAVIVKLGPSSDLARIAQQLFAGLRELDSQSVAVILVRAELDKSGLGLAIWDRLFRAAECQVIEVRAAD